MATLTIKNLYKSYGKTEVLKGISIDLNDGEFLVLVGPSGCGKSTLLNAIAGLEEINEGSIYLGDKEITTMPPKDRKLSMVFQSYALYPNMTVRENIEFGLKISKYPKDEIDNRVKISASTLHIEMLLDRKPAQLSGGQRQRVAIARSIAREPEMYLFDEPLSNLDAELRVEMRAEIKKLHRKVKKTMVYVTHDQVEAMTLADKVAVMHHGKIQQFDSPKNLYDNPKNVFTAGFIGSPAMNFVDVIVDKKDNKFVINLENEAGKNNQVNIDNVFTDLDKYIGKKVIAGIRPSHIQNGFRDTTNANASQEIETIVSFSELTGSDLFLYTILNGVNLIARVSTSFDIKDGDTIKLQILSKNIIFFDKETKERIR